jgi:hypothetical protein
LPVTNITRLPSFVQIGLPASLSNAGVSVSLIVFAFTS